MNLVQLLIERAELHPERPALIDSVGGQDRVVTYRELAERVAKGAAKFQHLGLKRGQHILVFQPVSIELYECLLAAFHAGIRVMLADPSAGRKFLGQCCDRVPPDAYFGPWKAMALRLAVPGLRKIPLAIGSNKWFPGVRPWDFPMQQVALTEVPDQEPALITFTSGSTGVPKAAVRTHGFLLAQHRTLSSALDFQEGEVDLITLPVFVLANLASGLTSVLAATNLAKPGTPDAAAVHSQCLRQQVTRCAASPAFFEGMLASAAGLPPFHKLFTGGAPVFNDLLTRLSESLPSALVHSVYGSTEAEPIAHFPAEAMTQDILTTTAKGGGLCAGIPVPEISVTIIANHSGQPLGPFDESDFKKLSVTVGNPGEIIVSGDHVLRGYLNGKGDEETKIKVGQEVWHRTGDAGWFDTHGRLWLLGRSSERMRNGSYPFAIECSLRAQFPRVRVAALEWKGEQVIVMEKSVDRATATSIREKATPLGMTGFIQIDKLPLDRRHNAKIDYPAMRVLLDGMRTSD